jgi:hypothetical protein
MICSMRMGLAVGITLVSALLCEPTHPCVMVAPRYKVLPNFDVVVQVPAGVLLEGIRVAISDLDKDHVLPEVVIAEAFTDRAGRVTLHGLKVGHHWMQAQRGEIVGEIAELDVVDSNGLTKVVLAWPNDPIYKVQRIAGTLLRAGIPGAPNMDQDKALAGVDLSLAEALSGLEIGKTSTDDEGKFAFPGVVPGLYAMHMKWHGIAGHILLEVNTKTKDAEPSRYFINPTDCGLGASKE